MNLILLGYLRRLHILCIRIFLYELILVSAIV
jgi:hypothetical protein